MEIPLSKDQARWFAFDLLGAESENSNAVKSGKWRNVLQHIRMPR